MRTLIAVLLLALTVSVHAAEPPLPPLYKARLLSVYDGDTFTVQVPVWHDLTLTTEIRLRGIDTPEIRGDCEREKQLAAQAETFTNTFLTQGPLELTNIGRDKYYGRVVANVTVNGKDLTTALIQAGLGYAYTGGTKQSWCQ